ncbi:hypothetical protein BU26DRAFT_568819 [Trematosphaeria pertusa]|uniref:Uncharacterized protein n=1 Tax=Trematosphaeria pertusa TaxID=390896 RepID=A0A6A6I2W7_9PLEO|nr:uncharacterized protein BU26DRAFT_568819 [Trematosphaeria pertusa]KAF2244824.1 hypothetical protein BU26DRAFT_568819 [Trematosphaeria pertusa]
MSTHHVEVAALTSLTSKLSFLGLPSELRNKVYKEALTADSKLLYWLQTWEDDNPRQILTLLRVDYSLGCNNEPFNQLKYVNRQLYRETAGLELKFNTLSFYHYKSSTAALFTFAATITPSKLAWLTLVVVRAAGNCVSMRGPAPESPDISMIVYFCKQNPRVQLRYIFPRFKYPNGLAPLEFMGTGVALCVALKGDDTLHDVTPPDFAWPDDLIRMAKKWRANGGFGELFKGVTNFTVFPHYSHLDQSFVADCLSPGGFIEEFKNFCIKWAQSWIDHGITPAN